MEIYRILSGLPAGYCMDYGISCIQDRTGCFLGGILMIAGIVIGVLIALYAGFVIVKKVKDIKQGRFCSCGCDSCPGCKVKGRR